MTISFLFRVVDRNPVHVRVGVWAGPRVGSRGKSGELVFRVEEWERLRDLLLVAHPDLGTRTPLIDIEGEPWMYSRQDTTDQRGETDQDWITR